MKKKAGTNPETRKRYVVYLIDGNNKYRSKNYKTVRDVMAVARRMKKKYKSLGYEVLVDVTEEVI